MRGRDQHARRLRARGLGERAIELYKRAIVADPTDANANLSLGFLLYETGDKTGAVVGALTVKDADEIMLITTGGQMVRTFVKDIREAGRNTMGVKLVNLDAGDKLQAIAPVISESAGEESPAAS